MGNQVLNRLCLNYLQSFSLILIGLFGIFLVGYLGFEQLPTTAGGLIFISGISCGTIACGAANVVFRKRLKQRTG